MECKINSKFTNFLLVLGNNQDGCLLTGDNIDVKEFRKIENPFSENILNSFKIAVGMSTCCIYKRNNVKFWGKLVKIYKKSEEGENLIFKEFIFQENIISVKICDSHILILCESGGVFSLGEGQHGQLGLGGAHLLVEYPKLINLPQIKINKIFTGVRTSYLIDGNFVNYFLENQNLFVFGSNKFNELGLITIENKDKLNLLTNIQEPILNKNLSNVKKIKTGFKHSVFITQPDQEDQIYVYGSGDNSKGVLGYDLLDKQFSNYAIKNQISVLTSLKDKWKIEVNIGEYKIKQIKCGWNNTFILLEDGRVLSTGYGKFGQLGYLNKESKDGKTIEISKMFRNIDYFQEIKIKQIISGSDFIFAIDIGNYKIKIKLR
jgi:alpha-tubulin suppressor-like RCC1 family protein